MNHYVNHYVKYTYYGHAYYVRYTHYGHACYGSTYLLCLLTSPTRLLLAFAVCYQAVERCHELQRHVALLADQDGRCAMTSPGYHPYLVCARLTRRQARLCTN